MLWATRLTIVLGIVVTCSVFSTCPLIRLVIMLKMAAFSRRLSGNQASNLNIRTLRVTTVGIAKRTLHISWMPRGCHLDVTNMHTFPNSQIKQSCTSPQHAHGLRPLSDGAQNGLPHGRFATPTNVVAADGDALVQLQECYPCRLELLIDVRCWDTVLGEADDVFQNASTGYHSLNGQATNR